MIPLSHIVCFADTVIWSLTTKGEFLLLEFTSLKVLLMSKEVQNPAEIPPEVAAAEPLSVDDLDLEQVEGSLNANPKWQSLLRYLAEEYFNRGYFQRANFAYGTLAACEPPVGDDLVGLARCQILIGKRTEAVDSLMKILEVADANNETREWARAKIRTLVATAAPPTPHEAAAGPPQSPKAPAPAPIVERTEKPEKPAEITPPVNEKTAKVITSLEKLGVVTSHDVPNEEQIVSAKAKLAEDPNNPLILDWYAFLLYTARRIPEAIEIYERLLKSNEATPNALYYLGNAYLKMSELNKAMKCWDCLKKIDPQNPLVKKVGRTIKRLGDLRAKAKGTEAPPPPKETDEIPAPRLTNSGLHEVEETLRKSPNKPEVLDWAAFAYYTAGHIEKSLAYYQRALLLDANNPEALYYVGNIFCRMGQFDDAVKTWAKLLAVFPEHTLAKKVKPKFELLAQSE